MERDVTRTEATYALLRSLLDWVPGRVQRFGDLPGPAPSEKRACGACGGSGVWRARTCRTCAGAGRIAIDAYTQDEVATLARPVPSGRYVPCDACDGRRTHAGGRTCVVCKGAGGFHVPDSSRIDAQLRRLEADRLAREGGLGGGPLPWEPLRAEYRRAGSYEALERVLASLALSHPTRHAQLMAIEVYGLTDRVSDAARAQMDETVEWVAARMPDPIRVPPWVRSERPEARGRWSNGWKRGQRNSEIRRLAEDGWTGRRLAREFGLSPGQVSRILQAGTA